MKDKITINNSFFDIVAFFSSFIVSFFRSIKLFLVGTGKKKSIFFNFLDFIFRKWTKYFWKKPSLYKISSFFGDVLNFILKNK